MKRLIPLLIIIMLTLCSCSAEIKTPTPPMSFNQRARVSVGDFSYECKICKNDEELSMELLSTNAKGMVMTCDGSNVRFDYEGMAGDVSSDSLPDNNALSVLYRVLEYLAKQESPKPSTTNEGLRYQGSLDVGRFVFITDTDNNPKSLTVSSIGLKILFKGTSD